MMPSALKWIILLAVLVVPFQLAGVFVYVAAQRSDRGRARRLGLMVPAGVVFAVGLFLFLWSYFHPGMMFMVSGVVNLFILFLLVAGTFLNLACSAVVMTFLSRKTPTNRGDQISTEKPVEAEVWSKQKKWSWLAIFYFAIFHLDRWVHSIIK